MSYKSTLQTHNAQLQENSTLLAQAIEKANGLPDAGGGGSNDVLNSLLDGSIVELNSDAEAIFAHACRGRENLVAVNLPSANSVSSYAFHSCTGLKSINAPNLVSLGAYCFTSCSALEEIVFPKASSLSTYAFSQCASLKKADFSVLRSIGGNAFSDCSSLTALIIRATSNFPTLSNVNAFTGTPIANGTGYIYVYASQVNTCKTGSNWSNFAAQVRAIEDYPEITGG